MARRSTGSLKLDSVGYWSEVKLDIVRKYASAYSKILAAQANPSLEHVYIDAFAGAGLGFSKTTGELIEGSPLIAVNTQPPFSEYHFIDLDGSRVENLRRLFPATSKVTVYEGDCNDILLKSVLPRVRYEDYRRALCLLDPYGLHLDWKVIQQIGTSRAIDMFLNFPVADMNRNVFWRNPEQVDPSDIARMDRFWGDDSWRAAVYRPNKHPLFPSLEEKAENEVVAESFRKRLRNVAGFSNVPEPMPMRNSKNAVVYYLFFASQKPVASGIVADIFNSHRRHGTP